ncbi:MAG: hypothetical protein AAFU49_19175 [Pseudomonadota bacterium]
MMRDSESTKQKTPAPSTAQLIGGLLVAAAIIGLAICVFVYLLSGLTRSDEGHAATATLTAAGPIFAYLIGFSLTLGLAIAKCLLALGFTGPLWWSLAGALAGAVAGSVYAVIQGVPVALPVFVISAMIGWALLLIARRVAGTV